jgi:hypothetical protein
MAWSRAHLVRLNHPTDRLDATRYIEWQPPETAQDREVLPPRVSLTAYLPPVDNQGSLGSCVSHSVAKLMEYNIRKNVKQRSSNQLSRLYIYWFGRFIMSGSPSRYRDPGDTGMYVINGFQAVQQYSDCLQALWPYKISNYKVKPTPDKVRSAKSMFRLLNFVNIPTNLQRLKAQLVAGNPISFGCAVYSSFMTQAVASSGIIPNPIPGKEHYLGGHCMLIVGYDDAKSSFLIMNSWGSGWGLGGFAWFPYSYMLNYAGEFFTTSSFSQILPNSLPRSITAMPNRDAINTERKEKETTPVLKRGPSIGAITPQTTPRDRGLSTSSVPILVEKYTLNKSGEEVYPVHKFTLWYQNPNLYEELRPGWKDQISSLLRCLIYCNIPEIDLNFRIGTEQKQRLAGPPVSAFFDTTKDVKYSVAEDETQNKLSFEKSWSALDAWENLEISEKEKIQILARSKKCEIRDKNFYSDKTYFFIFH